MVEGLEVAIMRKIAIAILMVPALWAGGAGCVERKSSPDASGRATPHPTTLDTMVRLRQSAPSLVTCLKSDDRDQVLSGAEYLASTGAPRLYDHHTDSHAQWREVGDAYLQWLAHKKAGELAEFEEGFRNHLSTRSPCYVE